MLNLSLNARSALNKLFFGDNLDILREHIADESVDLIYLDPPFNSKRDYSVLFKTPKGHESDAQITAFEDSWSATAEGERANRSTAFVRRVCHGIGCAQRRLNALCLAIIILIPFYSCSKNDLPFEQHQLRWIKQFYAADTIIYGSSIGQIDTVMFQAAKLDTIRYRNWIEIGWYDKSELHVEYTLTAHSYHKILAADSTNSLIILDNDREQAEFGFLGLTFNDEVLDSILRNTQTRITFGPEGATYHDLNINEGIKSFTLDINKGIVSFIDKKNNQWHAIN